MKMKPMQNSFRNDVLVKSSKEWKTPWAHVTAAEGLEVRKDSQNVNASCAIVAASSKDPGRNWAHCSVTGNLCFNAA